MLPQTLTVKTRDARGKGPASRIRLTGEIPGVLYGDGKEVVHLNMNLREFDRLIHGGGEHAIVQLEVKDNPGLSGPALLKDVQHHPVRGVVVHADFLRIRLDQRITTLVPVVLTGQCKGVIEGGVIDYQLREVEVECLALEVPQSFTLDITELTIGDSLHVSDFVAPEGVRIVTDLQRAVVAVHAPRLVREEAAVAEPGAEAAEPELVGGEAKKEDEEKEKGTEKEKDRDKDKDRDKEKERGRK